MAFWVYMVRCGDGSIYVGQTDDLDRRIAAHEARAVPGYTSMRPPVSFLWAQEFDSRDEALQRERQIKGWNRAKKLALAQGDWNRVSALAHGRPTRPDQGSDSP